MHMSDGIIDAPTSIVCGVVAVVAMAVAAAMARRDLDERTAPAAGLVAAILLATQLINFPVLPWVSGHLLGAALAAILVGPWAGALCVAVVLAAQALISADGGLSALGANVTNMAVAATAAGLLVALALRRLAVRSHRWLVGIAFGSALVATAAAAGSLILQYAVGGDAGIGVGSVAWAVLGVHALIGVGEALITALTVGAVARVRPDLVHLLRTGGAVGARRPAEATA